MPPANVLRIANCSGYYGDRASAAREMVFGGPIDVLTGDYLAELTMLILWKDRQRNPDGGYAASFLAQMRDVLGECLDRNIKIVVNAGGLNPSGLADRPTQPRRSGRSVAERGPRRRRRPAAAADDLAIRHIDTGVGLADAAISPVTANAYLGAWGIATALKSGADVVITGRVTDASLVVGPSAWAFDWALDDWDRLAGAVAAGHILECGAQATGGNYASSPNSPGSSTRASRSRKCRRTDRA